MTTTNPKLGEGSTEPWYYVVNVGPTKGRIVEPNGTTVINLENHLRSSKFESLLKQIVKDHNQAPLLIEARDVLERLVANKSNEPIVYNNLRAQARALLKKLED